MFVEMGGNLNINNEKHFARKIYVEFSEIEKIRRSFNNIDVYCTVFSYDNRTLKDSNLYGPLYIDLDMNNLNDENYVDLTTDLKNIVNYLNLYYDIPVEYIKIFFTGYKGFHLLLSPKIFNITPNKKLNIYYKKIALELKSFTINNVIDTQIYDNKRLLRLYNSINSKSGLYKVPISYEDAINFTFKELQEYASSPKKIILQDIKPIEKATQKFQEIIEEVKTEQLEKEKRRKLPLNVDIKNVKFQPCINYLLKNGAGQGERNNSLVALSSAFFQKGINYDVAYSILMDWNIKKCDPPLIDIECEKTIESAYNNVTNGICYGCSSLREISKCNKEICSIYKNTRR